MILKIKSEHAKRFVGFKGAQGKPLSQLNQSQLRELAIIGRQSNDASILGLFEGVIPGLQDLQTEKVDVELAKLKVKEVKEIKEIKETKETTK